MAVLKKKSSKPVNSLYKKEMLFERDIWKAEELGLQPDSVHGMYHFNFQKLRPAWLKHVVKRFVHYQSATRSYATCYSYINRLNPFAHFLMDYNKHISPEDINRALIVKYIGYLSSSNIGVVSKNMCLTNIRTLHGVILRETWLPWPNDPLVYPTDFATKQKHIPKFIPEYIVSQLQSKLHHLPDYLQNLAIILLETGRRLGEVCSMPFDCLSVDPQGDHFLVVGDRKLKKSYLIPISDKCLAAIKAQQSIVKRATINPLILFPARNPQKAPHISGRWVNTALNQLSQEQQIVDEYNKVWKFHSHQFRHTVGTRMINSKVPQAIVQKYLGHESAEMTARYAHIHNDTMKKAFIEYQGNLVDIHGKSIKVKHINKLHDAKWLKHNMIAQALPNGICNLPAPQRSCPHANACLTCVHFNTHKEFLPQHKKQLATTNDIIAAAKDNGWDRVCEMNLRVRTIPFLILKP